MDNFVNSVNSAGLGDLRNLVEQVQPAVSTEAAPRLLSRVEVDNMLTEYVRDALPGENRIEAKTRMLTCFDTLQKPPYANIELDLSRLHLKALPENLSFLNGVSSINLDFNQLESLPESIGQHSTLETLRLAGNKLRSLPASIGQLSALKSLYLIRNQLQSLPTSIGRLSALKNLFLGGNQLANLPESIGQLSALGNLSLTNNQLDCLPASVGQLSVLTILELDENRFESLPEFIATLSALLTLRLSGNQLRDLPESIGNLPGLQNLELHRNNLSELPQSLVCLSSSCIASLDFNPLSQAVRQQLQNAIVAHHALHPEQGPRVEYDMRQFNQAVEVKSLSKEIATWRAEGHVQTGAEDEPVLETAIGNLSTTESNALSGQLARMRLTAQYAMAPYDVVKRVNAMLDYMQKEPSVLSACAAIAVEGTETCDDRIALAFIELEEAIVHHQSLSESNLAKLVQTAGGLHRSQLLKNIAQQKVSNLVGFVDPTEIILKYVVNLSKEFNLPSQLNDMIFHRCARQVTDQDIQSAREQIQSKFTDEHLNTYLANWEPWKQALSKKYPNEYQQAQLNVSQGQEALQGEMIVLLEQLNATKASQGELSQQYLDLMGQSNELHAQYRAVETGEVLRLTQHARDHAISL
ncbi:NEL-type E3 ubiquitin ligase domain-containing protein [Limnobacter parvus]|uniref:NEL domain-containing protein n=1 Tax=Limnobacter parvus TaxID=2939690 RepID=A0ABT1XF80_9BURK|nr:NEL-type E3 ubiquitin ligase domain-containing protein [Limnobacter parvus]MCR2745539.1 hypothetical protein [Limnobacter parvus]